MFPILFQLGGIQIATYGVCVAVAYVTGLAWLNRQIPFMPRMTQVKFWIMISSLFVGAIVGSKLLFVAAHWPSYRSGELRLVQDFRYGFVFFGGLVGTAAMGLLVRLWIDCPYWPVADHFGIALPMFHWIGRIGCIAAGCCHGKPTSVPWGIRLGGHPASATPRMLWGVPLHPTQVYEAVVDIAICVALVRLMLPRARSHRIVAGTVFLSYVALYSSARFVIEFFRGDDRGWSYGGLWVSQWIALVCVAMALGTMAGRGVWRMRRRDEETRGSGTMERLS